MSGHPRAAGGAGNGRAGPGCVVVVGCQWGDEGKGKIVDVFAEDADVVARYQGGANAGHTVRAGDQEFVLHQVPSGVLHAGKRCLLGNGVVVDLVQLFAECDELASRGVDVQGRIGVSTRAHVVFQHHKALDAALEQRAARKIGTTGRGIGPAYEDKVGRRAVRLCDLRCAETLRPRLGELLLHHNALRRGFGIDDADAAALERDLLAIAARLLPYAAPVWRRLHRARREGRRILYEGAQGAMLDIDHGTYPFVTSSNTVAGHAAAGAGVGAGAVGYVLGIAKAYTTRVGGGPFPTELDDETGRGLGERGREFGTVTGRRRRCGWFDAVLVRQAVEIGGVRGIALTKLDVLDGMPALKVCAGYRIGGEAIDHLPAAAADQALVRPVYETLEGWRESTRGARSWADLPATAVKYIRRIEELIGAPVALLSTSPERDDTILVQDPFAD